MISLIGCGLELINPVVRIMSWSSFLGDRFMKQRIENWSGQIEDAVIEYDVIETEGSSINNPVGQTASAILISEYDNADRTDYDLTQHQDSQPAVSSFHHCSVLTISWQ